MTQEALRTRLGRLAWILDSSIRIPVLGWRIGVESLLGLVPGAGDAVGAILSGYILVESWRAGASRAVLARMAANIALEALVGLVPVLGDLFDMAWKANVRNVRLLEHHLDAPQRAERSGRLFVWGLVAALLLLVAASVALGFLLGRSLLRAG